MGRPSIFSKDYEKLMKRRKRRIFITILLLVILVCFGIFKFNLIDINFGEVKQKIQAWVDSDKPKEDPNKFEPLFPEEEEPKEEEEVPLYMDVKVNKDLTLKIEYKEEDGKKTFISLEESKLKYDISPSKEKMIVLDKNQDLYLINKDGKVTDVTKKEYVSTEYGTFYKKNILKNNPKYIWHKDPKFISDNVIIYISCVPYFGETGNQYFWTYNLKNKQEQTLWNLKNPKLEILALNEKEKGIEVKVGKESYIIDEKGNSKKIDSKKKEENSNKNNETNPNIKDNQKEDKEQTQNKE